LALALSVLVALTLTPALCATLLKPHAVDADGARVRRPGLLGRLDGFFIGFNRHFDRNADRCQRRVAGILRRGGRTLLVYLLIGGATAALYARLPPPSCPTRTRAS